MDDPVGRAILEEPPHPAFACPTCGKLYEVGFEVEGRRIPGHVPGSPPCLEARDRRGKQLTRDARERKAARARMGTAPPPPSKPMTDDERTQREEALREKLRMQREQGKR